MSTLTYTLDGKRPKKCRVEVFKDGRSLIIQYLGRTLVVDDGKHAILSNAGIKTIRSKNVLDRYFKLKGLPYSISFEGGLTGQWYLNKNKPKHWRQSMYSDRVKFQDGMEITL